MTGYNPPKEKAWRMAQLLIKYPNKGISRDRLARQCSLANLQIGRAQVTQLWPWIEQHVVEAGYFANRPTYWSKYLCSATDEPLHASIVRIQRNKNVATRLSNDTEIGATLKKLAQSPDIAITGPALLSIARNQAWLDAWRHQETDLIDLEANLLSQVMHMPKIPANARP